MFRWCFIVALAGAAGCDVLVPSNDDGVVVEDPPEELPPPPEEFGVVTAPRTGDLIEAQAEADAVRVAGLHTRADEELVIEALIAPYDRATSWTAVATVRTAATPVADAAAGDPRFGFEQIIDAGVFWSQGAVLQLRVRDAERELIGFFHDSEACLEDWSTWRQRAQHCGSVYTSAGIALVSTDFGEGGLLAITADEIFLDDKGTVDAAETAEYYAAIDAPATLTDFRARYLVGEEVTAAYYNAADLATGRDMHCSTFPAAAGTGVACAVGNYGLFGLPQADAEAELLAGVQNGGVGAFATVAMVYTPPIDAPNAVQFVVYGGDGALLTEAILDTHGDNAAVPSNCLNCHGSHATYDADANAVSDARFLPFDPSAFDFLDAPGLTRGDQEDALRRLNQLFLQTEPGPAMDELVRGMYGGRIDDPGRVADVSWTPPGWAGESASRVYREVVALSCRGCHASREADMFDFTDEGSFAALGSMVSQVVCGGGNDNVHRMPSAEAAQWRFWNGRARAYLAALVDLRSPCAP